MKIVECGSFATEDFYHTDMTPKRVLSRYELEFYDMAGGESYVDGVFYRHTGVHILFSKPGMMRFSVGKMRCYYFHFFADENLAKIINEMPVLTVPNEEDAALFSVDFSDIAAMDITNATEALAAHSIGYRILERLYRLRAFSKEQEKLTDNDAVLLAKEYIEEHYGEKLTLEKLSEISFLSKNYLRERFTACLGVSPAEYLTHIRVAKVLTLLATNTVTQKEAAYLCGFSGQSHMIATVKKYRGDTPRRLIENSGKNSTVKKEVFGVKDES